MKSKRFFDLNVVLFCGIFFLAGLSRAQFVTIPDANFVTYLQAAFPSCMTGNQLDTTCADIQTVPFMDVSAMGIADLTGIQYFPQLFQLICHTNLLTSLPPFPETLEFLDVSYNQLDTLPILPPILGILHCTNNDLLSITALPSTLVGLYCHDNLLETLPPLPGGLTNLYAQNNNLVLLPHLPVFLAFMNINNNPGLECLPYLPENLYQVGAVNFQLNINGTSITCIPNLPGSTANVNSLPVCETGDLINNPNNCTEYSGIYGMVYNDTIANCNFDGTEPKVSGAAIYLLGLAADTLAVAYTDWYGYFEFNVPVGNYTVQLDSSSASFNVNCADPGIDSVIVLSGMPVANINFSVDCVTGTHDIGVSSVSASGWVFPGEQHHLNISAGNMAGLNGLFCPLSITGELVVTFTGPVTYEGPAPGSIAPTSVVGNTLIYSGIDFNNINWVYFQSIFETATTADTNDIVCVNVTLNPLSGDNNIANNNVALCYRVFNSYDPNVKEVYPEYVLPGYDDWLTYTIHFQNTGSAPAFNIDLIDTLDAWLIANTFELRGSSHSVGVLLSNDVLTFSFDNILLPDSISDPLGSIGWVQYSVKPLPGLPDGTKINNECYIYFDYNAPILTNTAITHYMEDLTVDESVVLNNVTVYPNPSTGIFTFSLPEDFQHENSQILVYNISGEKVLKYSAIEAGIISVDLTSEKSGIYFMTISDGEQFVTSKLVKY